MDHFSCSNPVKARVSALTGLEPERTSLRGAGRMRFAKITPMKIEPEQLSETVLTIFFRFLVTHTYICQFAQSNHFEEENRAIILATFMILTFSWQPFPKKIFLIYGYVSLLNPRLVQFFTLDPSTLTLSFFSFAKTQRLQA